MAKKDKGKPLNVQITRDMIEEAVTEVLGKDIEQLAGREGDRGYGYRRTELAVRACKVVEKRSGIDLHNQDKATKAANEHSLRLAKATGFMLENKKALKAVEKMYESSK